MSSASPIPMAAPRALTAPPQVPAPAPAPPGYSGNSPYSVPGGPSPVYIPMPPAVGSGPFQTTPPPSQYTPPPYAPPGNGGFLPPSAYGIAPAYGTAPPAPAAYPAGMLAAPALTACLVCGALFWPTIYLCPRCQTPTGSVVKADDSTASTYTSVFALPPGRTFSTLDDPESRRKHRRRLFWLVFGLVAALLGLIAFALYFS